MLFRYIALLDNFDSDMDELDLSYKDRTLKIRKILQKEIEEFLSGLELSDPIAFDDARLIGKKMYWIDYYYEVHNFEEAMIAATNAVIEEKEEILLALRLFKEGCLRIAFDAKKGRGIGTTYSPFGGLRSRERTYFLKESELPLLKAFLKENCHLVWEKKKSTTPLGTALGRFTDGYDRSKLEDRVIDYVIGLEALYLQGESMGEFGYKIATRASILLADDKRKRTQLFRKIKKSYNLRGKIVHGRKYTLSREDVWFIEDVLRDSIKKFIETPKRNWLNLIFET